jgi:hypothetical protein
MYKLQNFEMELKPEENAFVTFCMKFIKEFGGY